MDLDTVYIIISIVVAVFAVLGGTLIWAKVAVLTKKISDIEKKINELPCNSPKACPFGLYCTDGDESKSTTVCDTGKTIMDGAVFVERSKGLNLYSDDFLFVNLQKNIGYGRKILQKRGRKESKGRMQNH
jgi:hypothetical protein